MDQLIIGTIAILAGCLIMLFGKRLVRSDVENQNKTFGFHFGKNEVKAGKRAIPLIGLIFIVIGLLGILHGVGWL